MKALTLTQPWATLIAIGAKRIETRDWTTSYRGLLAIHAAKGLGPIGGKSGLQDQCRVPAFAHALRVMPAQYGTRDVALTLGAIVAVARLVDVRRIDQALRAKVMAQTITPNEIEFGCYDTGRYAWFLEDVRPLRDAVECKGALSLWDLPSDVRDAVDEQIGQ